VLLKEVKQKGGLDYLQVFEIDGKIMVYPVRKKAKIHSEGRSYGPAWAF